jgi:aspartate aminotransferase
LILNNPELFEEWKADIRTMAGRIINMRKQLHEVLTKELKTPGNWDHIVNQIGMFRCVGDYLTLKAQVCHFADIVLLLSGATTVVSLEFLQHNPRRWSKMHTCI